MFRNSNMSVRFRPRDGMQIIVRGRLSIYEGRGDYQLIASSLEEAGDGALRRRFEMLKQKLSEEGLFASERKRAMPEHVRHIGVVTSATGAVIKDIVSVLGRRFPAIRITLLPVPVQGVDAVPAIVKAIALANKRANELAIDVLIVGRGGGSLEDLQAFNEEAVARAIFESKLPIVSAVGHETDFTIADLVADLRAPTPSAAAELLSPDQDEMLSLFNGYQQLFSKIIKERLQRSSQQLLWLLKQLKHPGRRLQEHAQTLDMLEGRMIRATRQLLSGASRDVLELQRRLQTRSPVHTLRQQGDHLEATLQRLHRGALQRLASQKAQLAQLARSLDGVQVGDNLTTRLADGSISSVVTGQTPGKIGSGINE